MYPGFPPVQRAVLDASSLRFDHKEPNEQETEAIYHRKNDVDEVQVVRDHAHGETNYSPGHPRKHIC